MKVCFHHEHVKFELLERNLPPIDIINNDHSSPAKVLSLSLSLSLSLIFLRKFQPIVSAPNDALYHQIKTPIGFWCMRGLNPDLLFNHQKLYQLS